MKIRETKTRRIFKVCIKKIKLLNTKQEWQVYRVAKLKSNNNNNNNSCKVATATTKEQSREKLHSKRMKQYDGKKRLENI